MAIQFTFSIRPLTRSRLACSRGITWISNQPVLIACLSHSHTRGMKCSHRKRTANVLLGETDWPSIELDDLVRSNNLLTFAPRIWYIPISIHLHTHLSRVYIMHNYTLYFSSSYSHLILFPAFHISFAA